MKIKRVLSVGAFCEPGTLEDNIRFFRDILGAKIGPLPEHAEQEHGFTQYDAWLGTEVPFRVYLNEPTSDADKFPASRQFKRIAPNFGVLAFEVENLDEAIAELRAKGIRVSDKRTHIEEEEPEWKGNNMVFIHPKDCFGRIIELVELKGRPKGMETYWD